MPATFGPTTAVISDKVGTAIGLVPQQRKPDRATDSIRTGFLPSGRSGERVGALLNNARSAPEDVYKRQILCLAATAALLDGRADKAQTYLKRYAKRYVPGSTCHLLAALALGQQNKLAAARDLLQRHALADWVNAWRVFPGAVAQQSWLMTALDAIMGRATAARGLKPSARAATAKLGTKPRSLARAPALSAPTVAPAATPSLSALEQLPVEIPLAIEADLTTFLSACAGPGESEGAWFNLRAQLAHLGLAEGSVSYTHLIRS